MAYTQKLKIFHQNKQFNEHIHDQKTKRLNNNIDIQSFIVFERDPVGILKT